MSGTTVETRDAAEVRELYAGLLACWNQRDAAGFAGRFAPEGSVVGFDGSQVDGALGIESHLRGIFADHTPARYVAIVREVRPLGPDVVLLRAVVGMVPPGTSQLNPAVNAVQSLIAQRAGGRWLVQLFQNTAAAFHGRPEAVEALTRELQRQVETPSS